MKTSFGLSVKARLDDLSKTSDFICDSMKAFGLDEHEIFRLQTAVDEACTNIINYGDLDKSSKIDVICRNEGEKIFVVVIDEGIPFNPLQVSPPDLKAPLKDRQEGGLGVHFIKTLMDHVKYERKGEKNVLEMVLIRG